MDFYEDVVIVNIQMSTSMTDNFSLDPEQNFGPIDREYELSEVPVAGEIPRGLNGTLDRNGPNPQFAPVDPPGIIGSPGTA
ncbi:MAG: Retinal pigment epithelial rane protein [Acetobacteraceae bacterium]|jgi:carotenoid cleavage dioxygenase-like enzyme|nr:Retinal pigment epithelial rane protein [Acetobacteraceae bacterium]